MEKVGGITANLSAYEQETIINFNEEEKTAYVYTHNRQLLRKLAVLVDERSEECKRIRWVHDGDAAEFVVPKKWVKISPPRANNMTDEQKAKLAERMRAMVREKKA